MRFLKQSRFTRPIILILNFTLIFFSVPVVPFSFNQAVVYAMADQPPTDDPDGDGIPDSTQTKAFVTATVQDGEALNQEVEQRDAPWQDWMSQTSPLSKTALKSTIESTNPEIQPRIDEINRPGDGEIAKLQSSIQTLGLAKSTLGTERNNEIAARDLAQTDLNNYLSVNGLPLDPVQALAINNDKVSAENNLATQETAQRGWEDDEIKRLGGLADQKEAEKQQKQAQYNNLFEDDGCGGKTLKSGVTQQQADVLAAEITQLENEISNIRNVQIPPHQQEYNRLNNLITTVHPANIANWTSQNGQIMAKNNTLLNAKTALSETDNLLASIDTISADLTSQIQVLNQEATILAAQLVVVQEVRTEQETAAVSAAISDINAKRVKLDGSDIQGLTLANATSTPPDANGIVIVMINVGGGLQVRYAIGSTASLPAQIRSVSFYLNSILRRFINVRDDGSEYHMELGTDGSTRTGTSFWTPPGQVPSGSAGGVKVMIDSSVNVISLFETGDINTNTHLSILKDAALDIKIRTGVGAYTLRRFINIGDGRNELDLEMDAPPQATSNWKYGYRFFQPATGSRVIERIDYISLNRTNTTQPFTPTLIVTNYVRPNGINLGAEIAVQYFNFFNSDLSNLNKDAIQAAVLDLFQTRGVSIIPDQIVVLRNYGVVSGTTYNFKLGYGQDFIYSYQVTNNSGTYQINNLQFKKEFNLGWLAFNVDFMNRVPNISDTWLQDVKEISEPVLVSGTPGSYTYKITIRFMNHNNPPAEEKYEYLIKFSDLIACPTTSCSAGTSMSSAKIDLLNHYDAAGQLLDASFFRNDPTDPTRARHEANVRFSGVNPASVNMEVVKQAAFRWLDWIRANQASVTKINLILNGYVTDSEANNNVYRVSLLARELDNPFLDSDHNAATKISVTFDMNVRDFTSGPRAGERVIEWFLWSQDNVFGGAFFLDPNGIHFNVPYPFVSSSLAPDLDPHTIDWSAVEAAVVDLSTRITTIGAEPLNFLGYSIPSTNQFRFQFSTSQSMYTYDVLYRPATDDYVVTGAPAITINLTNTVLSHANSRQFSFNINGLQGPTLIPSASSPPYLYRIILPSTDSTHYYSYQVDFPALIDSPGAHTLEEATIRSVEYYQVVGTADFSAADVDDFLLMRTEIRPQSDTIVAEMDTRFASGTTGPVGLSFLIRRVPTPAAGQPLTKMIHVDFDFSQAAFQINPALVENAIRHLISGTNPPEISRSDAAAINFQLTDFKILGGNSYSFDLEKRGPNQEPRYTDPLYHFKFTDGAMDFYLKSVNPFTAVQNDLTSKRYKSNGTGEVLIPLSDVNAATIVRARSGDSTFFSLTVILPNGERYVYSVTAGETASSINITNIERYSAAPANGHIQTIEISNFNTASQSEIQYRFNPADGRLLHLIFVRSPGLVTSRKMRVNFSEENWTLAMIGAKAIEAAVIDLLEGAISYPDIQASNELFVSGVTLDHLAGCDDGEGPATYHFNLDNGQFIYEYQVLGTMAILQSRTSLVRPVIMENVALELPNAMSFYPYSIDLGNSKQVTDNLQYHVEYQLNNPDDESDNVLVIRDGNKWVEITGIRSDDIVQSGASAVEIILKDASTNRPAANVKFYKPVSSGGVTTRGEEWGATSATANYYQNLYGDMTSLKWKLQFSVNTQSQVGLLTQWQIETIKTDGTTLETRDYDSDGMLWHSSYVTPASVSLPNQISQGETTYAYTKTGNVKRLTEIVDISWRNYGGAGNDKLEYYEKRTSNFEMSSVVSGKQMVTVTAKHTQYLWEASSRGNIGVVPIELNMNWTSKSEWTQNQYSRILVDASGAMTDTPVSLEVYDQKEWNKQWNEAVPQPALRSYGRYQIKNEGNNARGLSEINALAATDPSKTANTYTIVAVTDAFDASGNRVDLLTGVNGFSDLPGASADDFSLSDDFRNLERYANVKTVKYYKSSDFSLSYSPPTSGFTTSVEHPNFKFGIDYVRNNLTDSFAAKMVRCVAGSNGACNPYPVSASGFGPELREYIVVGSVDVLTTTSGNDIATLATYGSGGVQLPNGQGSYTVGYEPLYENLGPQTGFPASYPYGMMNPSVWAEMGPEIAGRWSHMDSLPSAKFLGYGLVFRANHWNGTAMESTIQVINDLDTNVTLFGINYDVDTCRSQNNFCGSGDANRLGEISLTPPVQRTAISDVKVYSAATVVEPPPASATLREEIVTGLNSLNSLIVMSGTQYTISNMNAFETNLKALEADVAALNDFEVSDGVFQIRNYFEQVKQADAQLAQLEAQKSGCNPPANIDASIAAVKAQKSALIQTAQSANNGMLTHLQMNAAKTMPPVETPQSAQAISSAKILLLNSLGVDEALAAIQGTATGPNANNIYAVELTFHGIVYSLEVTDQGDGMYPAAFTLGTQALLAVVKRLMATVALEDIRLHSFAMSTLGMVPHYAVGLKQLQTDTSGIIHFFTVDLSGTPSSVAGLLQGFYPETQNVGFFNNNKNVIINLKPSESGLTLQNFAMNLFEQAAMNLMANTQLPLDAGEHVFDLKNFKNLGWETPMGRIERYEFDLLNIRFNGTTPLSNKKFIFGYYAAGADDSFQTITLAFARLNDAPGQRMLDLAKTLNLPMLKRSAMSVVTQNKIRLYGYDYNFMVQSGGIFVLDPPSKAAVTAVNFLQTRAAPLGGPVAIENIKVDSVTPNTTSNPSFYTVSLTETRPDGNKISALFKVMKATNTIANITGMAYTPAGGSTIRVNFYGPFNHNAMNLYALEKALKDLDSKAGNELLLVSYSQTALTNDSIAAQDFQMTLDSGESVYIYSIHRDRDVYSIKARNVQASPVAQAAVNAAQDLLASAAYLNVPDGKANMLIKSINRISATEFNVTLKFHFENLYDFKVTVTGSGTASDPFRTGVIMVNNAQIAAVRAIRDLIEKNQQDFAGGVPEMEIISSTCNVSRVCAVDIRQNRGNQPSIKFHYNVNLSNNAVTRLGATFERNGRTLRVNFNDAEVDFRLPWFRHDYMDRGRHSDIVDWYQDFSLNTDCSRVTQTSPVGRQAGCYEYTNLYNQIDAGELEKAVYHLIDNRIPANLNTVNLKNYQLGIGDSWNGTIETHFFDLISLDASNREQMIYNYYTVSYENSARLIWERAANPASFAIIDLATQLDLTVRYSEGEFFTRRDEIEVISQGFSGNLPVTLKLHGNLQTDNHFRYERFQNGRPLLNANHKAAVAAMNFLQHKDYYNIEIFTELGGSVDVSRMTIKNSVPNTPTNPAFYRVDIAEWRNTDANSSNDAELIYHFEINASGSLRALRGVTVTLDGNYTVYVNFGTLVDVNGYVLTQAVRELKQRNIQVSQVLLTAYQQSGLSDEGHEAYTFTLDAGNFFYDFQGLRQYFSSYSATLIGPRLSGEAAVAITNAKNFLVAQLGLNAATHQSDIDAIQNIPAENIVIEKIDPNTFQLAFGPYQSRFLMTVTKNIFGQWVNVSLFPRDAAALQGILYLMREVTQTGGIVVKPGIPLSKIVWNSTTAQPCGTGGVCDSEIKEIRSASSDIVYKFHYDPAQTDRLKLLSVDFTFNTARVNVAMSGVTWTPGEVYNWRNIDAYALETAVNSLRGNGATQYTLYHSRQWRFGSWMGDGFIHEFELASPTHIYSFWIREWDDGGYAVELAPVVYTNNLEGRSAVAVAKALNISAWKRSALRILTTNPDNNTSTADIELYGNVYHFRTKAPAPANIFDLSLLPPKQQAAIDALNHLQNRLWELSIQSGPDAPLDVLRWTLSDIEERSTYPYKVNIKEIRPTVWGQPSAQDPSIIYHFDVTATGQTVSAVTFDRRSLGAVKVLYPAPISFTAPNNANFIYAVETAAIDLLSRVSASQRGSEIVMHDFVRTEGPLDAWEGTLQKFRITFDTGEARYTYKIRSLGSASCLSEDGNTCDAADPDIENNPVVDLNMGQKVQQAAKQRLAERLSLTNSGSDPEIASIMNQIVTTSIQRVIPTATDLADYKVSLQVNGNSFDLYVDDVTGCSTNAANCSVWLNDSGKSVTMAIRDLRAARGVALSSIVVASNTVQGNFYNVDLRETQTEGEVVHHYRIAKTTQGTTITFAINAILGMKVSDKNNRWVEINFNGLPVANVTAMDYKILQLGARVLMGNRVETQTKTLKFVSYGTIDGPNGSWKQFNFEFVNEAAGGKIYGLEVVRNAQDFIIGPEIVFEYLNNHTGWSIIGLANLFNVPMRQRSQLITVVTESVGGASVDLKLHENIYKYTTRRLNPEAAQMAAVEAMRNLIQRGAALADLRWSLSAVRQGANFNIHNVDLTELRPDGASIIYHYLINAGNPPSKQILSADFFNGQNTIKVRFESETAINAVGFHAAELALNNIRAQLEEWGSTTTIGDLFLYDFDPNFNAQGTQRFFLDDGRIVREYWVTFFEDGPIVNPQGNRVSPGATAEINAKNDLAARFGVDVSQITASIRRINNTQYVITTRFGQNEFIYTSDLNLVTGVAAIPVLQASSQAAVQALVRLKNSMAEFQYDVLLDSFVIESSVLDTAPTPDVYRVTIRQRWTYGPVPMDVKFVYEVNATNMNDVRMPRSLFEFTNENGATISTQVNFGTNVNVNSYAIAMAVNALSMENVDLSGSLHLTNYQAGPIGNSPTLGTIQLFNFTLEIRRPGQPAAPHLFALERRGDFFVFVELEAV